MQDPEKLREIDSLGEESSEAQEDFWEEAPEKSGWGGAPLLQAVLCAAAILALVFFKLTDESKYQEIAQWYHTEMSQEIELPQLYRATPEPMPSPTPEPSPSVPPVQTDAGPLQML